MRQTALVLLRDARRYWWVIALAVAICLGSTAYFAAKQVPSYRSRTTLVVVPNKALKEPREISASLDTLDRRSVIATLAMLPDSKAVMLGAMRQLQLADSQAAPYKVKTAVVPDSNAIEITVAGPDPRIAAGLANALADQSLAGAGTLYGIFQLQVLDRAEVPRAATGTDTSRKMLAAGLFGLLAGLGAALVLARLNKVSGSPAADGEPQIADNDREEPARAAPTIGSAPTSILQGRTYGRPRGMAATPEPD